MITGPHPDLNEKQIGVAMRPELGEDGIWRAGVVLEDGRQISVRFNNLRRWMVDLEEEPAHESHEDTLFVVRPLRAEAR